MEFLGYLLALAAIWFIVSKILSEIKAGDGKHCLTCGTDGRTTTNTRGSIWNEVVLWICFIVPGLIYSLWRHSSRSQVCRACGSGSVVPTDSPAAIGHRRQLGA